MPIFEYECSTCGEPFEQLVLRSSAPPSCPGCGGRQLVRRISAPTVSSETTRGRASQALRRRNRSLRSDYQHEETKRLEAHARDHDD